MGQQLEREQIRFAFKKMIGTKQLYEQRHFCFFIDGLDEYEETTRYDYTDLIELLHEWIGVASGSLKICVSSRELPAFDVKLDSTSRLRLHDLTRNDIKAIVKARLSGLLPVTEAQKRDSDLSSLMSLVVDRAEGVFLWVNLVLQSLRDGWGHGDGLPLLLEKVHAMPLKLNDLFMKLLISVDEANKRRAYQMLAVATKLDEFSCSMSALFYSFLNDVGNMSLEDSACFYEEQGIQLSQPLIDDRLRETRLKVMAYSKGLLEMSNHTGKVTFTHRTACDFLRKRNVQELVTEHTKDFEVQRAICLSFVAEVRALRDPRSCSPEPILQICEADWREPETPKLLDHIGANIRPMQGRMLRGKPTSLDVLDDFRFIIADQAEQQWDRNGGLTCEAVRVGLHQYVQWKMNRPLTDEEAVRLFMTCVFSWLGSGDVKALSIMRQMLESRLPPNEPGGEWTLWIVFLMICIEYGTSHWIVLEARISCVIDAFLLNGAEPRIVFDIKSKVDRGKRERVSYTKVGVYAGEDRTYYEFLLFTDTVIWLELRSGSSLQDLIDRLRLPDAQRLKTKIDQILTENDTGLGHGTSEAETSQLVDPGNAGSRRIAWTESLGLPKLTMIAITGQYVTFSMIFIS